MKLSEQKIGQRIKFNGKEMIRSNFSRYSFWVDIKTGVAYTSEELERHAAKLNMAIEYILKGN